jgi:hypothetical protein
MVLDGKGTLWVQGYAALPGAPRVEGSAYPWIVVPLGDRRGAFSDEEQKARAVFGRLAPGGKAYIAGTGYLYNERGERIYQLPPHEAVADIDAAGTLLTIAESGGGFSYTTRVREYSPDGLLVAEVTITTTRYPLIQVRGGAVYSLVFDPEDPTVYTFIRWERK